MQRAVVLVGGGLSGFLAGSMLCAPLLAWMFGPTPVTWDATNCPPGVYTIISTARSLSGSETFVTASAHVRLPRPVVAQEFPNLPPGDYIVTAVARNARGQTLHSAPQMVAGRGEGAAARTRGHRSPAAPASNHTRGARASPPRPAQQTAPSGSASPTTLEAAARPASVTPLPARAAPAADALFVGPILSSVLGRRGDLGDFLASNPDWQRVSFIDSDTDGVVDIVTIEWPGGEIWVVSAGR